MKLSKVKVSYRSSCNRPAVACILALMVSQAWAAETVPVSAPQHILGFSGGEGAFRGASPYAPPVWDEATQRLYGVLPDGGSSYQGAYGGESGAVLYRVDPSKVQEYEAKLLEGELGASLRSGLQHGLAAGRLYGNTMDVLDGDGQKFGGRLYAWPIAGDQALLPPVAVASQAPEVPAADFKLRGQMAFDPQGYIYFGATERSPDCFNGKTVDDVANGTGGGLNQTLRDTRNTLYRVRADGSGAPEPVVNFCDFAEVIFVDRPPSANGRPRAPLKYEKHVKASQPEMLFWSTTDNALYGIAYASGNYEPTQEGEFGSVRRDDNKGKPSAALFRIPAESARGARLSPADRDKVEILHWFGERDHGGAAVSHTGYINALIEDGDWIYGSNRYLWRYYKGNDASVTERFQVLNAFGNTDVLADQAAEDGRDPSGAMVIARDGNIYGTTRSDSRAAGAAGGAATGTVYRLVIDRSTPANTVRYELLSYLDLQSVGAMPVGLSAGGVVDNSKQRLYGATRSSADTSAASGRKVAGGLFFVDIPLPAVRVDSFTARLLPNGAPTASLTIQAGETPTLQWQASNATVCHGTTTVDGGEPERWTDSAPDGSRTLAPLNQAGSVKVILSCEGQGVVSPEALVDITVLAREGGGTGENGGDGSQDSGSSGGGGALGMLLGWLAALTGARRLRKTSRLAH